MGIIKVAPGGPKTLACKSASSGIFKTHCWKKKTPGLSKCVDSQHILNCRNFKKISTHQLWTSACLIKWFPALFALNTSNYKNKQSTVPRTLVIGSLLRLMLIETSSSRSGWTFRWVVVVYRLPRLTSPQPPPTTPLTKAIRIWHRKIILLIEWNYFIDFFVSVCGKTDNGLCLVENSNLNANNADERRTDCKCRQNKQVTNKKTIGYHTMCIE